MKESTEAIVGFDAALVGMQAHTLMTADAIQGLGEYASVATDNLSQFHELDAIAGLEMLARAGEDVGTAMGNLPAVLDLAVVAGMNVASAADTIVTTMNQFNMSTMDATRVADVYTKASQMSTASTQELASMMRYMAATMDGAGYSFEDTTAYVTAFINAGMMARQASGALSTAVQSLSDMNAAGQAVLDKYGVALRDATGKVRPLIDVVLQLKNAGASTTDMLSVFGASSQKITTVLANLGKEGFDKLVKGLEDSKGAAKDAADILQTSLASSLETTQKSLNDIWLSLGKDMKPALQWFMGAINGILDIVKKAVQSVEGWSTANKAFIGTFVGLSAVILPLMMLINNFTKGIGLLKVALMGAGAVQGPFAIAAIAVVALTAVVLAGITAWNDYRTAMSAPLPIISGPYSTDNIKTLQDDLDKYDAFTKKEGLSISTNLMGGDNTNEAATFYASRLAKHNWYVAQIKQQNDGLAANALNSRNATSRGIEVTYAASAKRILDTNQETQDQIDILTHSTYQNALAAINKEADAKTAAAKKDAADGKETEAQKVQIATWRTESIKKLDADTAAGVAKLADTASKASDAALKKTQATNDAIIASQAEAQDALDRITLNTTQYALKQLDILMAQWRVDGVSEVTIAAYSAQQKKIIWGDYNREVLRLAEEAAKKEADLLQEAQDNATAGIEAMQADIADHVQKATDVWAQYKDDVKTFNQSIEDFLLATYQHEYEVQQHTLDRSYQMEIDHLDRVKDSINDRYDLELDKIRQVADEKINGINGTGGLNADLQALRTGRKKIQDAEELAKLQADIADATTDEERTRAEAALKKYNDDISYYAQEQVILDKITVIQDKATADAKKLTEARTQATKDAKTLAQLQGDISAAETPEERATAIAAYNLAVAGIRTNIAGMEDETGEAVRNEALDIQLTLDATTRRYETETADNKTMLATKSTDEAVAAATTLLLQGNTHAQIVALMASQLKDYAAAGTAAGTAFMNAYKAAVDSAEGSQVPPPTYAPPSSPAPNIPVFASGGWAGLHGTETIQVGERGPEFVSSAGAPSIAAAGGDSSLLREVVFQLKKLQATISMSGAATVTAIRG